MKKTIVSILLISTINVFSQGKFGIAAGVNYSYFTDGFGQMLAEESYGLQLGIVYEKQLFSKVHFRPKILFSQQGDRTRTNTSSSGFEIDQIDTQLNYVNIPLDIKIGNKIYVIVGPQVGFLISDKKIGDFTGNPDSNFDFGLNLGMGFTIKKLFIEAGIYQGLSSIYEYQYVFTGNTVNVNNGVARVTIGLMLN
jgi:hypothetical protein